MRDFSQHGHLIVSKDYHNKYYFDIEQMVKDEITKKYNIEVLNRKLVNELIDMIYITDKNNIKIEFKNMI